MVVSFDVTTTDMTAQSVAMDGSNAVAVGSNSSNVGAIYYSTNSGSTWTQITTGLSNSSNFSSVAINGTNAVAVGYYYDGSSGAGVIYYSANSGSSWTQITTGLSNSSNNFSSVAINGTNAVAVGINYVSNVGVIYYSADSGSTWTQITGLTSTGQFSSVAINTDMFSVVGGTNQLYNTPTALCLNHDTKILCFTVDGEKYVPIQDLREGDLVKSYLHGYRKINCIGKNSMINKPSIWNQSMWKMEKTDTNDLIEDLIMLGGHSLLVDTLSDEMKEIYKEKWECGLACVIDGKVLLIAGLSGLFTQSEDTGIYTYYQLTLDNEGDLNKRFGIWANGVLVETPSENQFKLGKWC